MSAGSIVPEQIDATPCSHPGSDPTPLGQHASCPGSWQCFNLSVTMSHCWVEFRTETPNTHAYCLKYTDKLVVGIWIEKRNKTCEKFVACKRKEHLWTKAHKIHVKAEWKIETKTDRINTRLDKIQDTGIVNMNEHVQKFENIRLNKDAANLSVREHGK